VSEQLALIHLLFASAAMFSTTPGLWTDESDRSA